MKITNIVKDLWEEKRVWSQGKQAETTRHSWAADLCILAYMYVELSTRAFEGGKLEREI